MKNGITTIMFILLPVIQCVNSPQFARADGSITLDSNYWIGAGDFFAEENWVDGELFGGAASNPDWDVNFRVSALYVNGLFVGYTNIPTGAAIMTSDYSSTGDLKMGTGVDTDLTIQNATYTLSNAYIGLANTNGYNDYVGAVYINGLGEDYIEYLNAPAAGTATVNINNGTMAVEDTLYIGYDGDGALSITNGGTVTDSYAYLGYDSGGNGAVTVDGDGSLWDNTSSLDIIRGTLNITNGGLVKSSYTTIGSGTVVVDGVGSTLSTSGSLYVGSEGGSGTLTISNGGLVEDDILVIGNGQDNDTVTVDGEGSILDSYDIYIGNEPGGSGSGTLNILNGSTVTTYDNTKIRDTGRINFGDNGGVLTTGSLWFSREDQLSGTGTINTSGIVSDIDITFDSDHGTTQSISVNDVVINLSQNGSNTLGVGYIGEGNLIITDGVSVSSCLGYLGYYSGATGNAIVDGEGSAWNSSVYVGDYGTGTLAITNGGSVTGYSGYVGVQNNSNGMVTVDGEGSTWSLIGSSSYSGILNVGSIGTGTLAVTNGGAVSSSTAYIGRYLNGSGTVFVEGEGSTWINSGSMYVGSSGTGSLSVTNGGLVSTEALSINSSSTVTVDTESYLNVGTVDDNWTGDITNNGTVRLLANARTVAGTYTPMSYGTMSGSGTVQALGGIWNDTTHTVTVSEAEHQSSGEEITIDLAETQRVIYTDSTSGTDVGLAFESGDTDLSFTAISIFDDDNYDMFSSLLSQLESDFTVLSGWDFIFDTDSGYSEGDEVYLSLFAGSDLNLSDLTIWHYDSDGWTIFDALDLLYDGTYANFTVTGFSGYAVTGIGTGQDIDNGTAPVPEPSTCLLFGTGLVGVIGANRRKKKK